MPANTARAGFPTEHDPSALLRKLREWAMVGAGAAANNRLDTFITVRMLRDAGVLQVSDSFLRGVGGGAGGGGPVGRPIPNDPEPDLTPPPVPTGFEAVSGVTKIQFVTDGPIYQQGHGHARTRIYSAPVVEGQPLPTFGDAVLYTDFPGNIGVAAFDPASSMRLWATWTSADGVESAPAGGTNGVEAQTGLLEDVHISDLSVTKLLAGQLSLGQYVQSADYVANTSGFRLQTLPGGDAFLEINGGAYIGGLVVGPTYIMSANYVLDVAGFRFNVDGTGQIGGFKVGIDFIQSVNYLAGSAGWRFDKNGNAFLNNISVRGQFNAGAMTGYAWPAAGSYGAHLSASGLLIGNANNGTYFQVDSVGNVFAPGFSVVGGSATFSGNLSAANGTFAGSLTAQVVNTENIVGMAISATYSSSGADSASVVASAPAGSTSLVILVYPGWSEEPGGPSYNSASLNINGSYVGASWNYGAGSAAFFPGAFVYTIQNPSGSYTITATSSGFGSIVTADVSVSVIVTKR